MIEVNHLSKSFKTKKKNNLVLNDISFTANPSEIYGLLGPNGAGKTTTLRTIATLLKPDKGTVFVNGMDVQKNSRRVRDCLGLLTSDMKLSGNLTPRDLLYYFGELNHLDRKVIVEKIESLSAYLDMADLLDKSVEKLSTGMKQKASIAVSLLHDPDVILFDEPTNGLDILAAKVVTDFLHDYKKQGKTVILSTHNMAEAEKLCDRLGILINGEIVLSGTIEEILQKTETSSLEEAFYALAVEKGVMFNV